MERQVQRQQWGWKKLSTCVELMEHVMDYCDVADLQQLAATSRLGAIQVRDYLRCCHFGIHGTPYSSTESRHTVDPSRPRYLRASRHLHAHVELRHGGRIQYCLRRTASADALYSLPRPPSRSAQQRRKEHRRGGVCDLFRHLSLLNATAVYYGGHTGHIVDAMQKYVTRGFEYVRCKDVHNVSATSGIALHPRSLSPVRYPRPAVVPWGNAVWVGIGVLPSAGRPNVSHLLMDAIFRGSDEAQA